MINYPEKCLRGRSDCRPLSQIEADDHSTFVCCGDRLGDPHTWSVEQDRFTFCVKSQDGVDDIRYVGIYDIHSQLSVLSTALVMDDLGGGEIGAGERLAEWQDSLEPPDEPEEADGN